MPNQIRESPDTQCRGSFSQGDVRPQLAQADQIEHRMIAVRPSLTSRADVFLSDLILERALSDAEIIGRPALSIFLLLYWPTEGPKAA